MKIKDFKITEIRQKSEPKTAIFETELEMLSYQKLERAPIQFFDRSSHRRCSMRKTVPKNLAIFTGNHLCYRVSYQKETPTEVFPFEYCRVFRNTFLQEHLCMRPFKEMSLLWGPNNFFFSTRFRETLRLMDKRSNSLVDKFVVSFQVF